MSARVRRERRARVARTPRGRPRHRVPAAGRALGGDELLHIGVVDAQHAHLCATTRPGALHGGAGLVEHIDVAAGAGRGGCRALDARALGADAREVVAHAAAAAHGFGRFAQGFVNAGVAVVVHALDAVAHGLHKAVDERGLDAGARRAHDASGTNRACVEVAPEFLLVSGPQFRLFHAGQRSGHAVVEFFNGAFTVLEVFFPQHIGADGLGRQLEHGVGELGVIERAVHGGTGSTLIRNFPEKRVGFSPKCGQPNQGQVILRCPSSNTAGLARHRTPAY